MVTHMNMMEVKRKNSMSKKNKSPFHIKHNYKRFKSVNGYKFWARDIRDARDYCNLMNWVLGGLDEKKENV